MTISSFLRGAGVAGFALCFTASAALATDLFDRSGSMKDDAHEASSDRPEFSANVAITSDYIFRGISQTSEHPAIQGGFDATYKGFYVGVWGSNLDFGGTATGDVADIEVDIYGGYTHKFGNVEADLGVLYYIYPDAEDAGAELDYVEFKFGLSGDISSNVGLSGTIYYSPEYTGELGETIAYEGGITVGLGTHGRFSPKFTALIGYLDFLDNAFDNNSYAYWNAGVEVGLGDKFTLDLRYWDTDIDNGNPLFTNGDLFSHDARFVATISSSW